VIHCIEAGPEHIPGLFEVRVTVVENALGLERLRELGITPESVASEMREGHLKGWVVLEAGRVVGFSLANSRTRSVWALFVLPVREGRGYGKRLLDEAVGWLWETGADRIWLETDPNTRAAEFYRRQGWREAGTSPSGEIHFELDRL
jgi:GNAT superfamily N-acetyltransferase